MCDESPEHDLQSQLVARGLTRRQFNALAASTAAFAFIPRAAHALPVTTSSITITTPDGSADCHLVHPASGKHPAVLLWPDFFGLRETYKTLANRLAESGYAVLAINPYYRKKPAPIITGLPNFQDKAAMSLLSELAGSIDQEQVETDTAAFVSYLDKQAGVDTKRKVGAMGYCFTGAFTFMASAAVPERVGAIASFHGGELVSKDPTSPHLLIPKMKAAALVAIAQDDDAADPQTKVMLRTAFAKEKLPAEVEVYAAPHGWCTPDLPYHREAQAGRAWTRLLALFDSRLA